MFDQSIELLGLAASRQLTQLTELTVAELTYGVVK